MIVEGIVTSVDSDGIINVAPMGPIVHGDFTSLTLRPFQGSTTYRNLLNSRAGVFHVVDRVGMIAEAAIRRLSSPPPTTPAHSINGAILADCCRWFEFTIVDVDLTDERSVMHASIIYTGTRRDFFGFNRARHAVIEAAILATRVHLLPREEILSALQFLAPAVRKTGGDEETVAFQMLSDHIHQFYAGASSV